MWYGKPMDVESPEVQSSEPKARSSRFAPLGIIFGVLGLLLFAYFVRHAGIGEIAAGIQRLGYGFILILAISSVRYIVRALAWMRCVEADRKSTRLNSSHVEISYAVF